MTEPKKDSKTKESNDDSDKAATQRVEDAEKRNDEVRAALKVSIQDQDKTSK